MNYLCEDDQETREECEKRERERDVKLFNSREKESRKSDFKANREKYYFFAFLLVNEDFILFILI